MNTPNKLHAVIDASHCACFLLTPEGVILESNEAAQEMFGYSEAEFLGLTRSNIIDHSDKSLITLLSNRRKQKKASGEIICMRKDGERFSAALTSVLYFDNESRKEYVIKMITDLSEMKKQERLLLETNRVARVGGWEYNVLKESLLWTEITREIHEVADDFVPDIHKAISFYDDPNERETIRKEFKALLEEGKSFDFIMVITTAKANKKHIRAIGKAERLNNITTRAYGTFQDITHEIELEEKLKKSEAEFRGAFEHSAIGMTIIGINERILQVNDAFCEILGYNKKEIFNLSFSSFTHSEELETDKRYKNLLIENKIDSFKREKRFIHKNGSLVWAYIAVAAIRKVDGTLLYFIIQVEDITQRKKMEFDLAKSEQEFRSLFDQNPDAVYSLNDDGLFLTMNPELAVLLETDLMSLIGKSFIPFCFQEDLPKVLSHFDQVKRGIPQTYEIRAVTAKGNTKNLLITNIPIIVDEKITATYGIAKDITERKKHDEERNNLIQELTQNNKDLKQFSYITSHNLRAPVTNLLALSKLINWENIIDEDNRMVFRSIEKSTQQLNNTINDLIKIMVLKEKREIPARLISFEKILNKVLDDFFSVIKEEGIQIITNFAEAPEIVFNEGYLESILSNLISNSIKFRSPERIPIIHLTTKLIGSYIQLDYSDNGLGIDLKLHQNRIFKLFQTFHHHKDSKGVGLYLIESQMNALGGSIQIKSEVNKGTQFLLSFKRM